MNSDATFEKQKSLFVIEKIKVINCIRYAHPSFSCKNVLNHDLINREVVIKEITKDKRKEGERFCLLAKLIP